MPKDIHKLIREKNRILNQWEQYYRKEELESFPIAVQFPTGSRCNLKCRFCTDRKEKETNSFYKDISFEEFIGVIENGGWEHALRSSTKIRLYGWGEPLYNPDYEKIVDHTREKFPGLGIVISTNGTLFDSKWLEKTLAIDNSEVNFSVNAATKETYRNLTGRDQFERVISNISGLINLREKYEKKNPYVSLSFVATTENISELVQFVNLAADLKADCICVMDVMILNEETERLSLMNEPYLARDIFEMTEKRARERKIELCSFITHKVDYFLKSFEPKAHQNICFQAKTIGNGGVPSPYFSNTDCFESWENFMVDESGEVYPCCHYGTITGTTPEIIQETFGNIHDKSFVDIWNGEGYRYLRRTVNTDNPPSVCAICPKKAGLD